MGTVRRQFFWGFISGISLFACASIPVFPFKFYNYSKTTFNGTLLGPTQQDDVPFSRCVPVNGTQQCIAMFYSEFKALVIDYKNTKQQLENCQSGRQLYKH